MTRLLILGLALCACAPKPGWYRADKTPTSSDEAYDERFEPLELTADAGCPAQGATAAPLIVLVPGVGGDGDEMHKTVPVLMATHPDALFMFRYTPWEQVGPLADRLVAGLNRLAECRPDGSGGIVVLSHSAGGVISSFAVAHFTGKAITLLTVASPLAGTSGVMLNKDASPLQVRLFPLLGLGFSGYPEAAAGVRVVHLRTSAKSDGYMRPSGEHLPNDRSVGVPGAPQFDLPEELDHPTALVYVAKRIADGTWSEWLKPATATP
jgi:hypothetical protein